MVYQGVVVARLLYATSAWWGFTTAADRQRIEGFLCSSVCASYRLADAPTAAQLFHRVKYVLHPLLPSRRSESYSLRERRERRHDYQLSCRQNSVTDKNVITRLLFKDMY